MDTGMLWSDVSTKSFREKLEDAVTHFRKTRNGDPSIVFVNPDSASSLRCDQAREKGVALSRDRAVRAHELRLH